MITGLALLALVLTVAGYGVWHAIRTSERREKTVGEFRRELDTYGGSS